MKYLKAAKNFLLANKWLFLGFLAIALVSYFYLNKIFSIHFVDEEDNLVLGYFLLGGQKLYLDLFSHHQPLAYIISAALQLITSPENIFMLIKRHREFMIAWSLIWSGILIWKFKGKVIIPLIIYEASKFYILGQLFLSESLAVYPILYLTLFLIDKNQKSKTFDYLILGLLISVSALLLAPLWPFLAVYIIILLWLKKPSIKQIIFLICSGLFPVFISLPFIDIYYYFHNVFYINFNYYIPQSGEEKLPWSALKSFISPITILFADAHFQSSGFILKIIAFFFIGSVAYLIRSKNFKLLAVSLILLTLSNIRYFTPGLQYYQGFHTLIWYSLFILISFYFFSSWILTLKNKSSKYFVTTILILGVLLTIYASIDLFNKNDMERDYDINYSQQYAFGEAIKVMKSEGDTLFVVPDQWLLYYQGDIKNNNKMVNFYGWMSLVWELNDIVVEKFKTNSPAFYYCDCNEEYISSYANDNYHQMIRDGSKTPLWVLNNKFNNLTDIQKDKLRFFHFQLE